MSEIDNKFWKNKKVLITGHTGFKGSWLSLWLNYLKADVLGYSLPISNKEILYKKFKLDSKVKNKFGDIRDYKLLKKTIKQFNPTIVFHLAAQPLVIDSYNNPLDTFNTNIIGTAHLMNSLINSKGLESIIVVTTDKVYENNERKKKFKEDDKLGGDDPYSCSKAASELIINSYNKSFYNKVGIATARSGNVIGGGDFAKNRIIPDILKSINKKESLIIRNPKSTRPWQHVFETINGYLILAEKVTKNKKKYSGSWNFGPTNDKITVSSLSKKLIKLSKSNIKLKHHKNNTYKEKKILALDSSKANNILGWSNKWSIEKSLEQIISWNSNSLKNNISEYSLNQIMDYMKTK